MSLELCLLIQTEGTTNMSILHYAKNMFYWFKKSLSFFFFSLTWELFVWFNEDGKTQVNLKYFNCTDILDLIYFSKEPVRLTTRISLV